MLFHIEFKFLSVSGTLWLKVTSMPWTAKVLGSNLTRLIFIQTVNVPLKKLSANYLSAYILLA